MKPSLLACLLAAVSPVCASEVTGGGVSVEGSGISQGAADKNPAATQRTATGSDGSGCPAAAPTAAVDATPGWLGDLAFDHVRNQWLVVSHAGKIHGRVMSNDAKPVTPVFTVSAADLSQSWAPMAAFGGGKYLVVWIDYTNGTGMYGRFVSAAGAPETQFKIDVSQVAGMPVFNLGGERTSSMRFDAATGRFVLVWQQRAGADAAVMTTIDASGARGPVVRIDKGANGGAWSPSVAVGAGEYCAVYDQRNGPNAAVSRVAPATLAAGGESHLGVTTANMDIAYNAGAGKYFLIHDAGYQVGVKGRVLNSCAAGAGADTLILPNGGYASVAANGKSKTFAAIGQNWQDAGNSYAVLGADGKTLSKGVLFAAGAKSGNFLPVIRANVNDGSFAATSSRDYEMTRLVTHIGCSGTAGPAPGDELVTWVTPAHNGTGSGEVMLSGASAASIKKIEILVNLKKVGDALVTAGSWAYKLDTSAYSGGINLSALAYDAAGKTTRWTIRFNVAR